VTKARASARRERFEAEILAGHKDAAVEVPFDPAVRWKTAAVAIRPGRRGHAVRGELAGVPFESFVVARSKRFWLLVEGELLRQARVRVGDVVAVQLWPSSRG